MSVRRAIRRQLLAPRSVRCTWSRSMAWCSSSSRVSFASSIARSGVGGAPLEQPVREQAGQIARARTGPGDDGEAGPDVGLAVEQVVEEPGQGVEEHDTRRRGTRPRRPRRRRRVSSLATFWAISAFASSISSRTSSEAFSETSLTISPSDFSAPSGGGIPSRGHRPSLLRIRANTNPPANAAPTKASGRSAKASCSAARRRAGDCAPRAVHGGLELGGGLLVGHQSVGRVLVEHPDPDRGGDAVGDDRAERADAGEQATPHEALDQVVVHRRRIQPDTAGRPAAAISRPPQIASTTSPLARSNSSSVRGRRSKIQPVSSCSIAP